jgi:hypothetical protein
MHSLCFVVQLLQETLTSACPCLPPQTGQLCAAAPALLSTKLHLLYWPSYQHKHVLWAAAVDLLLTSACPCLALQTSQLYAAAPALLSMPYTWPTGKLNICFGAKLLTHKSAVCICYSPVLVPAWLYRQVNLVQLLQHCRGRRTRRCRRRRIPASHLQPHKR